MLWSEALGLLRKGLCLPVFQGLGDFQISIGTCDHILVMGIRHFCLRIKSHSLQGSGAVPDWTSPCTYTEPYHSMDQRILGQRHSWREEESISVLSLHLQRTQLPAISASSRLTQSISSLPLQKLFR